MKDPKIIELSSLIAQHLFGCEVVIFEPYIVREPLPFDGSGRLGIERVKQDHFTYVTKEIEGGYNVTKASPEWLKRFKFDPFSRLPGPLFAGSIGEVWAAVEYIQAAENMHKIINPFSTFPAATHFYYWLDNFNLAVYDSPGAALLIAHGILHTLGIPPYWEHPCPEGTALNTPPNLRGQ